MMMPKLEEVDRKLATADGKGSIQPNKPYLILYDGKFFTGKFIVSVLNLQFESQTLPSWFTSDRLVYQDKDPKWQGVWKIKNVKQIMNSAMEVI